MERESNKANSRREREMTKYRTETGLTEDLAEADISLCNLMGGCHCMTYSILSEDSTHFKCGKCGNTK